MAINLSELQKYGTVLSAKGSTSIPIVDIEKIYICLSGTAEVFCTSYYGNELYGRRNHLFSVAEGDMIFGMLAENSDTPYRFLLVGILDTKILVLERSRFIEFLQNGKQINEAASMIDRWITHLSACISSFCPNKTEPILYDKEKHFAEGTTLRAAKGIVWVRHTEGSSFFLGESKNKLGLASTYFPLSPLTWMTTCEDAAVDVCKTSELLEEQHFFDCLASFHHTAVFEVIQKMAGRLQSEKQQAAKRQEKDHRFVGKALTVLLGVMDQETEKVDVDSPDEDFLLQACKHVGKSMGISILAPHVSKRSEHAAKDPIGDIAGASRIRHRLISLEKNWWKQDNGAILAFMGEEERPIALIPKTPGQYVLIDPQEGKTAVVTSENAETIHQPAYIFYRPFPNKELSVADVLEYGIAGCWKRDMLVLLLAGMAGGILGMIIPIVSGMLFDSIIPLGERTYIWQIAFLLFAGALAGSAFQVVRSFAMMRLETRMDMDIQAAVWDRLLALPVAFFKDYSAGDLAKRAMGISQIRKTLSSSVVAAILSGVFSVFSLGLLFYYDLKLAFIAGILTAVSIIVTFSLGWVKVKHQRQVIDISNGLNGFIIQMIDGISKLKIAGAEERAFFLWAKSFGKQRKAAFKAETISNILDTVNIVLPLLSTAIIFFFYIKTTHTTFTPGNFIAFNAAFVSFFTAMLALSDTAVSSLGIIPLYENAKPILSAKPEYDDVKSDPGQLTGDIELSHVSFRYGDNYPMVLKDISLHIKAGEYVAIVGPSGCGKSTLLRILLGFERAVSGNVYYDGQDIENIDIRNVRKQIGVVLQNGKLMPGNIFSNIIGANPGLTVEDAWEAARAAGLAEDISQMPMGMYTMISEGAGTISGGQRQRLLIARALVGRPKTIYFDEATSALDNLTQSIVSQSLDKTKATRVVIAHRLSTIIGCDRVIVMDKGGIVESGSYHELMAKSGVFSELAKRQLA